MATAADVAQIAETVCEAFSAGRRSIAIAGIRFNLRDRGYCARFVRQCHEAAIGAGEWTWAFGSRNALEMERKLKAAGHVTEQPVRGDIIGFSTSGRPPGHIAIHLGGGKFAENTSSTRRGPGFVISSLGAMSGRITDYYSVLAADRELKVILLPGSEVIDCHPAIENGVARVDLRPVGEALDCEVIANGLDEDNIIYLRR